MRDSELNNAIRGLTAGGCIGLSNEFRSPDKAKELLREIIKQLFMKTGVPVAKLVEDIVKESRLEADAEIARLNAELKRSQAEVKQLQTELANKESKKKVNRPETLGYGTSFTPEVYEELDRLIAFGYNNRIIADKLGIHRNTVMNRRRKIQNNMK